MATVANLDAVFTADTSNFDRGVQKVRTGIGGLGTFAAGAAAAAAVAVGMFAKKSVDAFAKLDTGMREVFTLLPGISDKAMTDMTDQLKGFDAEFGVLSDQSVPALYQALSAGVPQGNVFDFLEQAQKAAKGGVTDLETAVDGLTSVVNTYGADIISAQEASDLMFTAVKDGKTTFGELSASISRVATPASSLGVGFNEVAAAMAAMTIQGTPTSEAATNLRGALNELGKEGSKAYDTFQSITGESFPEFVAGGGTLQQALDILAKNAEDNGGRITDSFGSIEAGMAAMQLTSDTGSAMFSKDLADMDASAGATDEAFNTMQAGIQTSFDRLGASWQNFKTSVGDKIAPFFKSAAESAADALNALAGTGDTSTSAIGKAFGFLQTSVFPAFASAFDALGIDWGAIWQTIQTTVSTAWTLIKAIFDAWVLYYDTVFKPAWEILQPLVEGVLGAIGDIINTTFRAATDILTIFADLLTGDFSGAWTAMQQLVIDVTTGLASALGSIWDGVKGTLGALWSAMADSLLASFDTMTSGVQQTIANLASGLASTWAGIVSSTVGFATDLWKQVTNIFANLVSDVTSAFGGFVDVVKSPLNAAIDLVNKFIEHFNSIKIHIPEIHLPKVSVPDWVPGIGGKSWGGDTIGGQDIGVPQIPTIPHLAQGGLVMRPTTALIGEAGPEAVIPLDRASSREGPTTIIVQLDGRTIAEQTVRHMPRVLRMQGAG